MSANRTARPSRAVNRPERFTPSSPTPQWIWWFLGLFFLAMLTVGTLVHWLTEYWWFQSVGFSQVFTRRLLWQFLCAAVAFALFAGGLLANHWLSLRLTRDRPFYAPRQSDWTPLIPGLIRYGGILLALLLALGAAQQGANAWEQVLQFINPTAFDTRDPIFNRDIGFYIFTLPLLQTLQRQGLELFIWMLVWATVLYAMRNEIRLERGWKYLLSEPVKVHLCGLMAAIALFVAWGYRLARFNLLYSSSGVVFGAGYTDVNARLSAYGILAIVTLVLAGLFIISLWRPGFSLPVTSLGLYIVTFFLVAQIYPWLQQALVVEPNELDKEAPYIAHNLAFTRQAYGLETVQREEFQVQDNLDTAALTDNASTLDNIRLWDYQTLLSTYQELQSLRLYYRFHDVDIDRYSLDGDYRQVMLSGRELDYDAFPDKGRNWVNQRLKYTHGYGLAMSPVNQVTTEGLPDFFVKNIPPETAVPLDIDQARIYYGEETNQHIYTGTSTDEFDYPLGNDNATNRYDGAGGVSLANFGSRLAYAIEVRSFKPLISNYFTNTSKIHYHRNILERAQQIVPFLTLDSAPYLAVVDGRMKWIIDSYTTSDRYPYAEPLALSDNAADFFENQPDLAEVARDLNYVRDAAKVIIDAYDGTLTVYALDETDPVLQTYQKIFPALFTAAADIPPELRSHFRYPLNFFQIQAQMYRAYHMSDTEVFYNQEDLWQLPQQIESQNQTVQMQPYYVIMRLPGAAQEEFLQILPFTPSRKDNMVAWMAARCDGDRYGELVLYEFPKQVLVYGPQQIDARIDQNPDISEQLTLWDQQGSSVIRGNILVIPVDQSLLYFEPVYLKADQGALPELKRVIVAYKDTIVMRQTLPDALATVFPETPVAVANTPISAIGPITSSVAPNGTQAAVVEAAISAFQESQTALQAGDWARYGQAQKRLGELLAQLQTEADSSTPQ